MSRESKEHRKNAARELRKSRNGGSLKDKADNRKRAEAFKDLAHSEEWLAGEKPRSRLPKE